MSKLIIKLEAEVSDSEADILNENGIQLYHDNNGVYVSCYAAPRRIYLDVTDAHIDREGAMPLGGHRKARA